MPVLISALLEDLDLVRLLASRLLQDGGEVRCYLDDDDYELRNLGCKVAVGRLDDDMNLEGALTNVHTFIPLVRDPFRLQNESSVEEAVNVAGVAARSASAAGVAQTNLALPALSGFDNPLGRAFAEIERVFVKECKPLSVFRTGLVWGEERPLARLARDFQAAPAAAKIGVVTVENLADLLAAADDREESSGFWEFGGPAYTLEELAALVAVDGVARSPGEGPQDMDDMGAPGLGVWMREVLAAGLTPGRSAEAEFGVAARPPAQAGDRRAFE